MKKKDCLISVSALYFIVFSLVYTCYNAMFSIIKDLLGNNDKDAFRTMIITILPCLSTFIFSTAITKNIAHVGALKILFFLFFLSHMILIFCYQIVVFPVLKNILMHLSVVVYFFCVSLIFPITEALNSNCLQRFGLMKYFSYIRISTTIGNIATLLPSILDKRIAISGKSNHTIKLWQSVILSVLGFCLMNFSKLKFVLETSDDVIKTKKNRNINSYSSILRNCIEMIFSPFGLILLTIFSQGFHRSAVDIVRTDLYSNQLDNFDEKKLSRVMFFRYSLEILTYLIIDSTSLKSYPPVLVLSISIIFGCVRPFSMSFLQKNCSMKKIYVINCIAEFSKAITSGCYGWSAMTCARYYVRAEMRTFANTIISLSYVSLCNVIVNNVYWAYLKILGIKRMTASDYSQFFIISGIIGLSGLLPLLAAYLKSRKQTFNK